MAVATDNDKEMHPIGDCGAHGFGSLYLEVLFPCTIKKIPPHRFLARMKGLCRFGKSLPDLSQHNYTAGNLLPTITGWLGTVIIRHFMDDYRLPYHVSHVEAVGKECHGCNPMVGE